MTDRQLTLDDVALKRGEQLRLLNAVALPKRLTDCLRAIDDHARTRSTWDGSYAEVAAWMRVSARTARRAVRELVDAGLLLADPVGSRYITDPDRRAAEGRDTETLYRFRIIWSVLAAPDPPHPLGQPDGQFGQLAGHGVQPAGQIVQGTSICALKREDPQSDLREGGSLILSSEEEKKEPSRSFEQTTATQQTAVTPLPDFPSRLWEPDLPDAALFGLLNQWVKTHDLQENPYGPYVIAGAVLAARARASTDPQSYFTKTVQRGLKKHWLNKGIAFCHRQAAHLKNPRRGD